MRFVKAKDGLPSFKDVNKKYMAFYTEAPNDPYIVTYDWIKDRLDKGFDVEWLNQEADNKDAEIDRIDETFEWDDDLVIDFVRKESLYFKEDDRWDVRLKYFKESKQNNNR